MYLVSGLLLGYAILPGFIISRGLAIFDPADPDAIAWTYILRDVFYVLKISPLLGLGLGTTGMGSVTGIFPHSIYLTILSEMGLVGLFAFLWILTKIFVAAAHAYKTSYNGCSRGLAIGTLASLFAVSLAGLGGSSILDFPIGMYFWFLAGVAISLNRLNQESVVSKALSISEEERSRK